MQTKKILVLTMISSLLFTGCNMGTDKYPAVGAMDTPEISNIMQNESTESPTEAIIEEETTENPIQDLTDILSSIYSKPYTLEITGTLANYSPAVQLAYDNIVQANEGESDTEDDENIEDIENTTEEDEEIDDTEENTDIAEEITDEITEENTESNVNDTVQSIPNAMASAMQNTSTQPATVNLTAESDSANEYIYGNIDSNGKTYIIKEYSIASADGSIIRYINDPTTNVWKKQDRTISGTPITYPTAPIFNSSSYSGIRMDTESPDKLETVYAAAFDSEEEGIFINHGMAIIRIDKETGRLKTINITDNNSSSNISYVLKDDIPSQISIPQDVINEANGGSTEFDSSETINNGETIYIAQGNINFREQPSNTAKVIGKIPDQAEFSGEILDDYPEWLMVKYSNVEGFVSLRVVARKDGEEIVLPQVEEEETQQVKTYTTVGQPKKYKTKTNANFRSEPDVTAQVITQIQQGTVIEGDVLISDTSWIRADYDGQTGYLNLVTLTPVYSESDKPNQPDLIEVEQEDENTQDAGNQNETEQTDTNEDISNNTTEYIKKVVTTHNANFRESPSQEAKIITVIPQGTELNGKVKSDEWIECIYKDKRGFLNYQVFKDVINTENPEQQTDDSSSDTQIRTTTSNVHLREKPSTESKSLGIIPKGTKVQFNNSQDNWSDVTVSGKKGFIRSDYLK